MEKPTFDNSKTLFENDPNWSLVSSDNPDINELFFKLIFAVLLVLGLGVAAIYVLKKLLPKITNLPGKNIRVIETVNLGPRKALHLIKTGSRKLLIGVTNESITHLADVTDALTETSAEATDNGEVI